MKSSLPRWSETTAVFGGAFDPPHLGHREAVLGLFQAPGVRDVIILPTGNPALKAASTSAEHRMEMARLNFEAEIRAKKVRIDDREIRDRSDAPSYTINTLLQLRKEYGIPEGETAPLAFVLGSDQVESLDRWYRFPEVLGLCHWIALERAPGGASRMGEAIRRLETLGVLKSMGKPGEFRTLPRKGASTAFLSVSTSAPAIASSEIRGNFARFGRKTLESARLHPSVEAYLKDHALYGT